MMFRFLRTAFTFLFLFTLGVPALAEDLQSGIDAYDNSDFETAFSTFLVLAEAGDVEAQFWVGILYESGKGAEKDSKKSFHWLKMAADNGHAQAQNHVGVYYYFGGGVEQNETKAIECLIKAAEQDAELALFNLQNMLEDSFFNQKIDYDVIYTALKASSDRGFGPASYYLSFFSQYGHATQKDPHKAKELTEKAANARHLQAYFRLAEMYLQGYGTEKSEEMGYHWYYEAALTEDPEAQWNVGMLYVEGIGVKQDYAEAIKWFEKSAAQEYAQGITSLAVMYANGQGVGQDYIKAHDLYMGIALKGFAHAQRALGQMYYWGQGVEQNIVVAKMWQDLAAEQGHEIAAKEAQGSAAQMTPDQLTAADELKEQMKELIAENLVSN